MRIQLSFSLLIFPSWVFGTGEKKACPSVCVRSPYSNLCFRAFWVCSTLILSFFFLGFWCCSCDCLLLYFYFVLNLSSMCSSVLSVWWYWWRIRSSETTTKEAGLDFEEVEKVVGRFRSGNVIPSPKISLTFPTTRLLPIRKEGANLLDRLVKLLVHRERLSAPVARWPKPWDDQSYSYGERRWWGVWHAITEWDKGRKWEKGKGREGGRNSVHLLSCLQMCDPDSCFHFQTFRLQLISRFADTNLSDPIDFPIQLPPLSQLSQ